MKHHLIKDYWTSVLRFRFCNSKIRNNIVLQRKNYGHFNILVLYLTMFILTVYLCLFVLVSLTLTFKYVFLQLAVWHF